MILGSGLTRLLWLVLLAGALMAFGGERAEAEESLASWYGPGFEGRPTASGETYDPNGLTAAHKTLPLGTEILVSYGERTVPVTITDRGPFTGERELDLSQGAARELGFTQVGVDYVDWTLANGAEPGLPQQVAQEPAPAAALQPELMPADMGTGYAEGAYPSYPRSYPPVQETASGGSAYTIQPGDTLVGIAAQLGTTADYLASRNGITDPNLIYSGQALYYPLVVEDPTGAGEHSTTDGAMTQVPPNVGGDAADAGEGALISPVYENVTPAFVDGTASPMAP